MRFMLPRWRGLRRRAACALAEVATTARLTCLAASPHPARLKEMAQAQAQADKAGEADKKRRLAQRLEAKAKAAAGQPTEGAKQQQVGLSPLITCILTEPEVLRVSTGQ